MTALSLLALGWAWLILVLFEVRVPVDSAAMALALRHLREAPMPPAADLAGNLVRIAAGLAAGAAILTGLAGSGWIALTWFARPRRGEPALRLLTAGALGFGAGGMALVGAALTGLLSAPVVAAITAYFLATAGRPLLRAVMAAARGAAAALKAHRGAWPAAAVALVFPVLLLPAALAPETDPLRDSLQHNLAVAARTARLHKLVPMPGNLIFALPPLTETVRAAGFAIQGEGAARLQNWWVTAALGALMGPVLAGTIGPVAGWLAGALYVTHPLVAGYTANAKADAVLGPLGFAAGLYALAWWSTRRTAAAVLAGLLVGLMTAVKTSAGVYLPLLIAGLLAHRSVPRARRLRAAGLAGAAFLAVLLPFWFRSALETGNPLYPFAGGVFGYFDMTSGEWAARLRYTQEVGQQGRYGSLLERIASPWTLSLADGFPPLWLALWPLAAVAARRGAGGAGWLGIAAAGFAAWAVAFPKLHYLFPLLAVGAVPVAVALTRPPAGAARALAVAMRVTAFAFVAAQAWDTLTAAPYVESLRAGTGLEAPGPYLARRLPVFADACAAARALVPGGAGRILMVGERQAYPLIMDHGVLLASSTQPFPLHAAIRASVTPRALGARIRQLGIRYVLHNFTTESFERRYRRRPWTPRDLGLWGDWWRGHARLLYRSPRVDAGYGWFLLYELAESPREATLSLPGIAGVVSAAEEAAAVGRVDAARETMRLLDGQVGMFATVQYALGTWELARGSPAEASRRLAASARQGLMHPGLFESLADLALARRDPGAAVHWAAAMVRAYPDLVGLGRLRELLVALSNQPPARSVDHAELAVVLDAATREARRTHYAYLAGLVDAVGVVYRR
ncbi:MAG: hypothetical protein AAB152_01915 [Candidatus Coatesbacteria bacterium]